jgi:hypothetical protein
MKTLITLFLLISFQCAYGQENKCDLLFVLLKNENVKQIFNLQRFKIPVIIFVDTNRFFEGCIIGSIYGRAVRIVHDSSYIQEENYSNLVLYNLLPTKKGFKLEVFYRVKQAYGWVEFKKKGNKFEVSKTSLGYF